MIKVLLVSHVADLTGAPLCLADLAAGANPDRFDVRVLLGSDGPLQERLEQRGFDPGRVDSIPRKKGRGLRQMWKLRKRLGEPRPDVVQVFQAVAFSKSVAVAARSLGIPVIWHLHNHPELEKFRKRRRTVQLLATRIVACAKSVARHYPGAKTEVIVNGVEMTAEGQALELPKTEFRFVFVGTLMPHKNVHLLVEAAAIVLRAEPDTSFLVVGGSEKPDYVNEVVTARDRLELGDRFRIDPPVHDVTPYYRAADAVVLPSATECFPRVVLEAAAAGRATLATSVGDVPDVIANGEDGWILEPGPLTAERLASALLEVRRAGRKAAARLGEKARSSIATRFPRDKYIKDFEDLWENLVG